MSHSEHPRFVIVGGGLAGALMAVYLGRAGYEVDVFEMRGDMRRAEVGRGRSINLAISFRGLAGLEKVGLADEVRRAAVAMPGRMIHSPTGELAFQPYGVDPSQFLNSVSRSELNVIMLDAAQACRGVRLHFNQKCTDLDLDAGTVEFTDAHSGERTSMADVIVIGADGAFSAVRRAMQRLDRFDYSQSYLEYGYKELSIPAADGGGFRIERNALHIWPRKSFMMIALPNIDGSFTGTLFWPYEGERSFAAIRDGKDLLRFFREVFPDTVEVMPTLEEDYSHNPVGSLVTLRCHPWHHGDRVVLIGDAAHAVVPFYGQGANAAFEDVLVFQECMERFRPDWRQVFEEYELARKVNTDTLANLAIENFVEMRDKTGSRAFLAKKKVEKLLARAFPGWYRPLYGMVTFTRTPYAEAVRRSRMQDRVVWIMAVGVAVVFASAAVTLLR